MGLDTAEFDKGVGATTQKGQTLQGKLEGVFKGVKTAITVAGIAMAVKGIGDALEKAGAVGDTIDESSQKLGLSRKAYQEWGYVLKQNGGNIESFGVAMKTLQNSMVQGTTASDAALAKLGLSAAKLKTLSPENALKATITAFQKMPEGAEKSAAAVDLFGKQGMELLPILNMSTDATEGLIKQANDLGIVLNDETIDAGAEFSDTLQTMKDTVSAAGTSFLTKLLPGITKTMDKLIPFFSNILPKLGDAFGKVLEKVAPLVETLVGAFTDAVTWIADNADTLIPILEGVAGAILLWNGYQAILNITMAANPIGAVITAVAYLAGGLLLLNSAFSGTSDGMSRFNEIADDIANNTTDFSDLVGRMTPNILNVNDLISSTGKKVSELQATIKEKEDAITAILKSAMEDHRALRQDELDDIAQYNADIASLNDELIEQYRSVELAKLRQIQLEAGDMTVEQMAQYEADMKAALESANKTSEDAYVARLATIENTHKAIGDIGSAAYLKEQQDAKANYAAQLAENKSYYDQAQAIFLESSAVLVGAEKKKNSDLQIEYQQGLDNLNKHYDNWKQYTTDHYKNMSYMDSDEAQRELAASEQLYNDQLALIESSRQPELDAAQSKYDEKYALAQSYFVSTNQMESDYAKEYFSTLVENREKELAEIKAKYDPQLQAIEDAHDAQYNEIYNHYGRVNELDTQEAQDALARIDQERQDQTAAWIALYADKNAAAEAGNTEQMQITQGAFDDLKAAQTQFNDDISKLENGALTSSNQTSANWLAGMLISNNLKTEANDQYAAAYASFLENLDSDAWSSFLYQYDVAKQAGLDIPAEYTTMLSSLLSTFDNMPADMQDEGKQMLNGLLGGVTDKSIRSSLSSESTNTANSVVSAIKTAWDIKSPSRVGRGLSENFMSSIEDGLRGKKTSLLSVAGSIANDLINSFLSLFGIQRTTNKYGQTSYSIPKHASGLERVPYDGYIASLHEGERVQTKAEAEADKRGNNSKVITIQQAVTINGNDLSYADTQRAMKKANDSLRGALANGY